MLSRRSNYLFIKSGTYIMRAQRKRKKRTYNRESLTVVGRLHSSQSVLETDLVFRTGLREQLCMRT